jgi:hypothetical protein
MVGQACQQTIAAETQVCLKLPIRDSMAQPGYPTDPRTWQCYEQIESHVVREAHYSMFTAPDPRSTTTTL